MNKKRTTVSLNEPIHNAGLSLMHEDAFDDFSEWLENLIRAKWREKHGAAALPGLEMRDSAEPPTTPALPADKKVNYKKPAAKKNTPGARGKPRKSGKPLDPSN